MNDTPNPQGTGAHYDKKLFQKAQALGLDILHALQKVIRPGMTEKDGRTAYSEILKSHGIEKNWHPPKIRFGPNSTKSFRQLSDEDYQLKENDIYFLDLGPIIYGHEADVGRSFTLGAATPEQTKIIQDGKEIFELTRSQFLKNKLKGPELYAFAEQHAQNRGWQLIDDGANGHRIGDFPHQVFFKGNLRTFEQEIIPDLWILEIQLRSPDNSYGSFYEDVL